MWVWVAYQKKKPWLPMAVADSATELADICGVPRNTVISAASKLLHGKLRRARYACVYVGGDD